MDNAKHKTPPMDVDFKQLYPGGITTPKADREGLRKCTCKCICGRKEDNARHLFSLRYGSWGTVWDPPSTGIHPIGPSNDEVLITQDDFATDGYFGDSWASHAE